MSSTADRHSRHPQSRGNESDLLVRAPLDAEHGALTGLTSPRKPSVGDLPDADGAVLGAGCHPHARRVDTDAPDADSARVHVAETMHRREWPELLRARQLGHEALGIDVELRPSHPWG